jgi:hypothetical protein
MISGFRVSGKLGGSAPHVVRSCRQTVGHIPGSGGDPSNCSRLSDSNHRPSSRPHQVRWAIGRGRRCGPAPSLQTSRRVPQRSCFILETIGKSVCTGAGRIARRPQSRELPSGGRGKARRSARFGETITLCLTFGGLRRQGPPSVVAEQRLDHMVDCRRVDPDRAFDVVRRQVFKRSRWRDLECAIIIDAHAAGICSG